MTIEFENWDCLLKDVTKYKAICYYWMGDNTNYVWCSQKKKKPKSKANLNTGDL